ncbi:hypothetical protein V6N13_073265 [Hibiscus sabdariffa]
MRIKDRRNNMIKNLRGNNILGVGMGHGFRRNCCSFRIKRVIVELVSFLCGSSINHNHRNVGRTGGIRVNPDSSYGPWMIVERRPCYPSRAQTDQQPKQVGARPIDSHFNLIYDLLDDHTDVIEPSVPI